MEAAVGSVLGSISSALMYASQVDVRRWFLLTSTFFCGFSQRCAAKAAVAQMCRTAFQAADLHGKHVALAIVAHADRLAATIDANVDKILAVLQKKGKYWRDDFWNLGVKVTDEARYGF
jgi:hypothetical protein